MTYKPQLDKNSANDTTAGYLSNKLIAGTNMTLTTNNPGGDETLTIATLASIAREVLQDENGAILTDDTGSILYVEVA